MSKISITIICIYILGTSYLLFEYPGILMFFITVGFGIFVVSFFIFPQIKVHNIMSMVKHRRILKFSSHLEDSLHEVLKDPTHKNIQRVKELFEISQSLNDMGEWPFNTKLLIPVLSGMAIPLIVSIIGLVSKFLNK